MPVIGRRHGDRVHAPVREHVAHVDVFFRLSLRGLHNTGHGAFAGGPFETDVSRAGMLKKLVERGYAGQLLLANDLCLKASLRKYGGWGYDHLFTNFAPMMRMEGVPGREIERLIRLNPSAFLFEG
ncbi:MAG: hypothetical protein BWY81_01111 [Firmicutes bacterium ADurb.Bin467]|nr:MAG: hypothetical protein BWY81_01111 [Firmicutes bacterium ADurb.Bin467]